MQYSDISVEFLTGGEATALNIFEITSVPHASVIGKDGGSEESIAEKYAAEIKELLGEIYQLYKSGVRSGGAGDVSAELLWTTRGVENQPYKAEIVLYIIFRAIAATEQKARDAVFAMSDLGRSLLSVERYGFRTVAYKEFADTVARIDDSSIKAIVKEEKAENLQNSLLPYCFSYDRLSDGSSDLSRLVNVLTDYPDCAVSMQLIPTYFSGEEAAEIDRTAQVLATLAGGISDSSVGNVSIALAKKQAENYEYYSGSKSSAMFTYNVLIYGPSAAAANISGVAAGQLSGGGASAALKIIEIGRDNVSKDKNFYPLPWAASEFIQRCDRSPLWNSGAFSAPLYRLPYIITADEAAAFFRLPIGSARISAGLNIDESDSGTKTYGSGVINSGDITVGRLKSASGENFIGFSLKDLAKHMLVVGTPGSGKTTFSVGLLDRLWKDHSIPFLVIEPAKNEYRALIQSIPDLQIFTPGKNFVSPFVFNPFVPPKNVRLEAYKSTLKTAFAAAVSMSTPLDKIFEESINNCYSDFRWLDTYTSDDKGQVFNITDFIRCFRQTFEDIGYTGDARNIGRAGEVRLKSLVNLFDCYYSVPIEDILKKPTVIELAAIENSNEKALIISILLLSILAYVNANYIGTGGLKNVILLEEAHVLLDGNTAGGSSDADPGAIARGLLKRMLAEIRSYGVGIIVADQSPRKVSTDVVALTDMKMIFRLVENTDKQIVADSTGMSDAQKQRLSKLHPGEAFMFFGRLEEPEEVLIDDYRLENNIDITLSDKSIAQLSTYWKDHPEMLMPYPQCRYCTACTDKGTCDPSRRILARDVARRIFKKHFSAQDNSFEPVLEVFKQISSLVKAELNDEPFSKELLACVKVHLWRKIYYDTKIKVREIQIKNSVGK